MDGKGLVVLRKKVKSEKVNFGRRKAFTLSVLFAALIFAIVSIGCASADLNDGLVAYYPFNGNANDESGKGNHLESPSGRAPTLTTDRDNIANHAYNFNNAGSSKGQYFFKQAGNKDLGFPENKGSFSAWIYPVDLDISSRKSC